MHFLRLTLFSLVKETCDWSSLFSKFVDKFLLFKSKSQLILSILYLKLFDWCLEESLNKTLLNLAAKKSLNLSLLSAPKSISDNYEDICLLKKLEIKISFEGKFEILYRCEEFWFKFKFWFCWEDWDLCIDRFKLVFIVILFVFWFVLIICFC